MKKFKNKDLSKELLRNYLTKSHVELICIFIVLIAIVILLLITEF